ncbi:MAG: hypothetical protein FJ033_03225 [Chloroflexi bacterium]|nr:hypothetical protein [Chloroflexota bacterium]
MTGRAIPMLSYEDCAAAIAWLCAAFGFQEVERFADESGRVTHAILEREGATGHIGWPGPEYRGPRAMPRRAMWRAAGRKSPGSSTGFSSK